MVCVYDFSHLDSFSHIINYKGVNYSVVFSYSNHVFTDKKKTPETPSHRFYDAGVERGFDEQRYEDSLLLPNLLKNNLEKSKIYNEKKSGKGKIMYFPHVQFVFRIILIMKRNGNQIFIFIETAHRYTHMPNNRHEISMNFPVAVERIYNNRLPLFK